MYVTPRNAAKHYKVSKETLRIRALSGEIQFITTLHGHRRYQIIPTDADHHDREKIIYARVSSSKQKKDLTKQVAFLQQRFPKHRVVKDVGSGFNFERRGFLSLLDKVMLGSVKEIVVAHHDRLTRIGFGFVLHICRNFHTKLTVLSSKNNRSSKREFTEEFISVITYYTSKFYGLRKYNVL